MRCARQERREAGGTKFSLLLLTKGPSPVPKAEGNRIVRRILDNRDSVSDNLDHAV